MASFNLYSFENYKPALKARVKDLRESRTGLTWRWLAQKIPIQYTYLSKALNDESTHLNEDHLFRLGRYLDFLPDEIDYLLLLRASEVTAESDRKEELVKKISSLQTERQVSADYPDFQLQQNAAEMQYLLDPLCSVIRMSLDIKEFRNDPRRLCSQLGISTERLKEILELLEANEFIVLGEDCFQIKEVTKKTLHYGRDHALMRVHQSRLKTNLVYRLNNTAEADKESFLATFTADDEAYQKIRLKFQEFLKEVQPMAIKSEDKKLYQLSFDFLRWL